MTHPEPRDPTMPDPQPEPHDPTTPPEASGGTAAQLEKARRDKHREKAGEE